jgi:hypothetical protein
MKLNDLKFDDDVGATAGEVQPEVTEQVPITQQLWRVIKDRPGITTKELEAMMPEHGRNVSTRLTQMLAGKKLAHKKLHPRGYAWYAIGDTYPMFRGMRPNKSKPKKATYHAKPIKEGTTPQTGLAGLSVGNMSVSHARALYLELHKIFGGGK